MDPNQPSQLDPKLKEVYDRVMGTTPQHTNPKAEFTDAEAQVAAPLATPKDGSSTPIPPSPQAAVDSALGTPAPTPAPSAPHLVTEEITDTHKMPDAGITPINTPTAQPTVPEKPHEAYIEPTPAEKKTSDGKNSYGHSGPNGADGPVVTHNENTVHGYIAPKPRSASSFAIFGVIGVIFVLGYSFVWFKLFHLPLPFIGK